MRGLPGTSRTPARADRTGAWRVAAVAVLLAVTAAGLRSRGTFSHAPDRALAGASGAVLAAVLIAAECVALVAFVLVLAMARPQRKPKADDDEPPRPPFPWWAKTLAVLAAVAAAATPFAVLLTRKTRPRPRRSQARPGVLGRGADRPPGLPATAHGPPWPLLAGMLIALAVLFAADRVVPPHPRATRLNRRATRPAWLSARGAGGRPRRAGRRARPRPAGRRSSRVTPRWSAASPRRVRRPPRPTPRPRCSPAPPGPGWSGPARPPGWPGCSVAPGTAPSR